MDKFLNSLHANDLSTRVNNVDEAFDCFCKRRGRLVEGSFNLRKFLSNSAELEQTVNKNYGILTEEYKCLMENKNLGLYWENFENNFIFCFNRIRERLDTATTKSSY